MNERFLHINQLSIGYQNAVCSGINAEVPRGGLIGLAGKNGSGKSTLLKTLLGLIPALSGEIQMGKEDLTGCNPQKRARLMSVVFSRLQTVPAVSAFELVSLGRLPYHKHLNRLSESEKKTVEQAFRQIGISELQNKKAAELSDGQLQMVMIARAIVQDTPLILMDEPTSHLDIENQFRIFELIYKLSRETGKTFIVASHQIELLLQNAEQLWWMDNGEFHAGFPEQIAYEQRVFEKLSQERIQFDYQSGSFRFQHPKNKKISMVSDGSDLAYWVKHALERNGFEVSGNEEFRIEIQNQTVYLNGNIFKSMNELMKYLNDEN
jgi:iron complex transport system ATP-binding protein